MLAPGHLTVGVTAYMGICKWYGYEPGPELYAAAALGSLLPDIDHPRSQVGRRLPHISRPIAAVFGHRGFTHSLLATILVMSLMFMYVDEQGASMPAAFITALSLGYLSHLLADFLTVTGIPFLWPWRKAFRIPLVAFRTGGPVEYLLTFLLASLFAYNYVY